MSSCNSASGGRHGPLSMKADDSAAGRRRLPEPVCVGVVTSTSSTPIPVTSAGITIKPDRAVSTSPMAVSPSCAPPSSMSLRESWRGSPLSTTPSRPTKDEASALWEIMATPPNVYTMNTQDGRSQEEGCKRSQSLALSSVFPLHAPSLVSPKSICPPYDSSLPPRPPSDLLLPSAFSPVATEAGKYSLKPRSSQLLKCSSPKYDGRSRNCSTYGLGPYLSVLPESVIYSIISYIDYFDRNPTMLLVSRGMTRLLTRPEFLFELRHTHHHHHHHDEQIIPDIPRSNGLLSQVLGDNKYNANQEKTVSNEMLFVVGGKCPTKTNNTSSIDGGETTQTMPPSTNNRRMAMQSNDYCGIMGYDQRRETWIRFGGDPSKPWVDDTHTATKATTTPACSCPGINTNNLHPLSPVGIVGAKPLFVGHPYYCLMFFGGTDYETGAPSSRVVVYSFLSGAWEQWPDMMRARHGEDFHVARVEGCSEQGPFATLRGDSIVLIGCDLEYCDCYRCNPPTCSSDQRRDIDADIINLTSDTMKSLDDSWKACEVLDLSGQTWARRKSRAPSCPPDDGGVAVVDGRFVVLPGTCPPPPTTLAGAQRNSPIDDTDVAVVTPLSQSEVNSIAEESKSRSSSLVQHDCQSSTSSMDTGDDDDEFETSPLGDLFRSLHYRPGLCYDAILDQWHALPARPYVTTSSPTTCSFNNRVVVLGGYRSSSENALSCYRHREEDSILDYEDHLDYVWWYGGSSLTNPNKSNMGGAGTFVNGEWTFGGGTTMVGHTQSWAHSSDMAAAVAECRNSSRPKSHLDLPRAPAPVRGGTATTYQGRLTTLGGLSTFSRTFYDSERKTIWQYYAEHQEWRRSNFFLPFPSLLDGYSFSIHI